MFRPMKPFAPARFSSASAPKRALPSFNTPKVMGFATLASEANPIPHELVQDADLHLLYMRLDKFFSHLNIGNDEAAQKRILEKYMISPGSPTLEWVHASPPPEHTYNELPLVKEPGQSDTKKQVKHH
eukprot:TRINITY_DN6332_c0_g3_i7.p1 TRINITY_DN6332_c0_g3~~TRINITY_DN6332_c0_g3_i7.p1  ORF type:complete len:128 (-),score=36.52 TRINITY_DN6332_c0_g3_i7:144-527(-)